MRKKVFVLAFLVLVLFVLYKVFMVGVPNLNNRIKVEFHVKA
jgi:biopolymer transport protein ExbD